MDAKWNESFHKIQGGQIFFRANKWKSTRETIVFLHGLGDSSLCFKEAFSEPTMHEYNILVPDLPGFGKSGSIKSDDYRFETQGERIIDLLNVLNIEYVQLVGHSMGGDVGVILCKSYPDRIKSFVNVEGDLTSGDRFITDKVKEAIGKIKALEKWRFINWYEKEYVRKIVPRLAEKDDALSRYLVSLMHCHHKAFLSSAKEIYELNDDTKNGESEIGKEYRNLELPKVYCWGRKSLSKRSQQYISEKQLDKKEFEDASHWLMINCPQEFYGFLQKFWMN